MKKGIGTLMAVLFVAAIATSAFAFGGGRGPGYGPCGRGDFQGPAGLTLTAEQKTKIKEMQETHWKDMKDLRDKMFSKRDEIRKLWLNPNPDEGKIKAAQKEMSELRDQIQDKGTAFRLESLKVLTPEQREKIASDRADRGFGPGQKHRRTMGPRHGFGPRDLSGAGCLGGKPGFGGRW